MAPSSDAESIFSKEGSVFNFNPEGKTQFDIERLNSLTINSPDITTPTNLEKPNPFGETGFSDTGIFDVNANTQTGSLKQNLQSVGDIGSNLNIQKPHQNKNPLKFNTSFGSIKFNPNLKKMVTFKFSI